MSNIKNLVLAFLMLMITSPFLVGQGIEDEIEFRYIKAKYLIDTERYEEAIFAFNDVINENPSFKDAMVLRAKGKYHMAAYKGAMTDVLESIGMNGATPSALSILGMTQFQMGNTKAAQETLMRIVGEGVYPDALQVLGSTFQSEGNIGKACIHWNVAAQQGSVKAIGLSNQYCGGVQVVKQEPAGNTTTNNTSNQSETTKNDSYNDNSLPPASNDGSTIKTDGSDVQVDMKPQTSVDYSSKKIPEEDNTPNDIVIDEDLTLTIKGQGLGKRKVLEQPNILILSDEDGIVAIDICVNSRGKVELAEVNPEQSTINKKSLISLAIRKSKDFWFEKNDYDSQCGVILYQIKGN